MDGVLFVGNEGKVFVALDPRQKKILWSFESPGEPFPFSPPPPRPPRRSSSAATTSEFTPSIRRPAARCGSFARRPGWTARRSLSASGCSSARPTAVLGLDVKTGKEVWRFEAGAAVEAWPAVAAGRMVIGATDGNLYLLGQKKR